MFYGKKVAAFLLIIGLALISPVALKAESSNLVSVKIAEICRYRILNSSIEQADSSKQVQAVDIEVLSNSLRTWQLFAITQQNGVILEWSSDQNQWFEVNSDFFPILKGQKVNWKSYRVYFRYRSLAEQPEINRPLQIDYQIIFND